MRTAIGVVVERHSENSRNDDRDDEVPGPPSPPLLDAQLTPRRNRDIVRWRGRRGIHHGSHASSGRLDSDTGFLLTLLSWGDAYGQ